MSCPAPIRKPYKTNLNPLHLVEFMSPHHLPHQATHGLLHHLHTSLVRLGILKCLEEILPTQHLTRTFYFGVFVGPKKVVLKLCVALRDAALEAGKELAKLTNSIIPNMLMLFHVGYQVVLVSVW